MSMSELTERTRLNPRRRAVSQPPYGATEANSSATRSGSDECDQIQQRNSTRVSVHTAENQPQPSAGRRMFLAVSAVFLLAAGGSLEVYLFVRISQHEHNINTNNTLPTLKMNAIQQTVFSGYLLYHIATTLPACWCPFCGYCISSMTT